MAVRKDGPKKKRKKERKVVRLTTYQIASENLSIIAIVLLELCAITEVSADLLTLSLK